MSYLRFEANETRAKMFLAGFRLLRGTAGGLPARRVDNSEQSTMDGLYWAFIRGHVLPY